MEEKKTGPGKGNRTRGKDRKYHGGNKGNVSPGSLEAIKKSSEALAESTERYKKIAEQRAGVVRYGVTFAATLRDRLTDYIVEQQEHRRPLTIAGLIQAADVNPSTWRRWREGERDYLLFEYMELNGIDFDLEDSEIVDHSGQVVLLCRFSTLVKKAELAVQRQLEENCYTNKGNPAGSIFGLKAWAGWQDTPPEQRTTNNNTLVLNNVASLDEARDAMKRLNG